VAAKGRIEMLIVIGLGFAWWYLPWWLALFLTYVVVVSE